ncbi:MAG: response regulator transcription factor [Pirellulaceae bacterium]
MKNQADACIAVVDDHPLIRRGFSVAIGEADGLNVCWTAASIAEAIAGFQSVVPKLVVIDLRLPDGDGLELIYRIRKIHADTRVLVSSMQDEEVHAGRCLKAGASGFISKSESVETLVKAIRMVLDDQVYLSEKMSSFMLRVIADPTQAAGLELLSDRELQTLEMIGLGKDTKTIAKEMDVSPKTVDSFRERIKGKLKIKNTTELIHYAVTHTLPTLRDKA